jgi:threonyl-tRNA synthetase
MAFLIEKYKGALPLWLSPVQVVIIPIAERHVPAAKEAEAFLRSRGIRAEVDDKSEPMGAKIRYHTLQKVPFMGIIGDKEVEGNHISLRSRKGEDLKSHTLESFLSLLERQLEHLL